MATTPTSSHVDIATTPWVTLVLALLTSVLLFGLDNTITASLQAVLIRHFNATSKLPWLSIAYLGSAAGTNLVWGQIYTQFNVKWLFLISFGLFETGSIVCGAAPSMNAFIAGRALCGLGGTGMYVGLSIIISINVSASKKPLYFSFIGLSRAIGTVLGPIFGGALAASGAEWRWAFYLNPLIGVPCAVAYVFIIPSFLHQRDIDLRARVLSIDFAGTALLCGCLVSFLMAISFGGTMYSWQNVRIVVLFILSGLLLILFFVQQKYRLLTRQRSFPIHLLAQPVMISLFVSTACSTASIFVPVYFIPLYFQFVHDYSALQAGVRLLPYIASNVATLLANGLVMSRIPVYMPWYLGGGCFTVAGSAALYTLTASTSNAKIYGFSILLGIGGGAYSQLAFSAIQSKIERANIPTAMAFCSFAQLLGPAIALGIANAVFLNDATAGIQHLSTNTPLNVIQEIISGASESHIFPGIPSDVQLSAIRVVVEALRKVFLLPLSAGALTVLMAAILKREKLFSNDESEQRPSNVSNKPARKQEA